MKTKHTKGPWEVDKKASLRVWDRNITIASCSAGQSGDNLEEQQANAKLIAAAPDLLEVCEMLNDYALDEFNKDWALFIELKNKCKKAIKKAAE